MAVYWAAVVTSYTLLFGFLAVAGIVACGDPRKPGPVNWMSWVLQVWLPPQLQALVRTLRIEWLVSCGYRVFSICCLRKNYLVMIMYTVLVLGGFTVVLSLAYPRVPNRFMSEYPHKILGVLVMGACLLTFILAAYTDPGFVNKKNMDKHLNFAFDTALYQPQVCRTCKILRPPRSKHCRVLDKCVAKADHYCIWLVNHVGERNYRWFLSFLIVHTMMLLYGAYALGCIFADQIVAHRLYEQKFRHSVTNRVIPATHYIVFQYLLHKNTELMACFLLCVVMGTVLTAFTLYHLSLAASNSTTNETIKYADARDFYKRDLERWYGHTGGITLALERVAELRKLAKSQASSSSSSPTKSGPRRRKGPPRDDIDVADAERRARNIPSSKADPEAPAQLEVCRKEAKGDALSELDRISALSWFNADPGPKPIEPSNIWTHGALSNLYDVFFPLSDRSDEERARHRAKMPGDYTGAKSVAYLTDKELAKLQKEVKEGATVPPELKKALE